MSIIKKFKNVTQKKTPFTKQQISKFTQIVSDNNYNYIDNLCSTNVMSG